MVNESKQNENSSFSISAAFLYYAIISELELSILDTMIWKYDL